MKKAVLEVRAVGIVSAAATLGSLRRKPVTGPGLDDLLRDPANRAVTARDRVRYQDLRGLVATARSNLHTKPPAWRL